MTILTGDDYDAETRLVIDLRGPQGNVFFLLAQVPDLCEQLGRNPQPVLDAMRFSSYKHAVEVFDREFGEYVDLVR